MLIDAIAKTLDITVEGYNWDNKIYSIEHVCRKLTELHEQANNCAVTRQQLEEMHQELVRFSDRMKNWINQDSMGGRR